MPEPLILSLNTSKTPTSRPMNKRLKGGSDVLSKEFVFLLLENFSMMAFSCAIEPLRLANYITGKPLYSWKLAAEGKNEISCSNGMIYRVDMGLEDIEKSDIVLVCGGIGVQRAASRPILSWLRRIARRGNTIGGMCTGTYVLASAGLLDGYKATIHWENQDGFEEKFTNVSLTQSIFVVDGNRLTTAGGISSIDMMLKIIAHDHGSELANHIADFLIYSSIRTDRDNQRMSIPTRIGVRHPKLTRVIEMMEASIEDPISPSVLAKNVHMSTRQLERLFRRYINLSPKRYYMELRLQKARNLLIQTNLSVINVALACGFSSPSHFSKCYRAHYNTTPYRERGIQDS